jgi:hypothetical protein
MRWNVPCDWPACFIDHDPGWLIKGGISRENFVAFFVEWRSGFSPLIRLNEEPQNHAAARVDFRNIMLGTLGAANTLKTMIVSSRE